MHNRARLALLLCALIVTFAGSVIAGSADAGGMYTIRQRFGVNVAATWYKAADFPGSLGDYAGAGELGFGWYSDWRLLEDPDRPNGIEFAQLLQTRRWPPDWIEIETIARANPGSLWIIGNEPETRGQGQHSPQEYAARYYEAYHFIKGVDPEADVAIGGVVMPSPLRLEWLELSMAYYESTYGEPMPIDVWNIHVQILQEKRGGWGCGIPYGLPDDEGRLYEIIDNADPQIFEQLIHEFTVWLYEHDQRDKPLIITEYGVLMPSSYLPGEDQDVLDFMGSTFDFMLSATNPLLGYGADESRLVQRWMWFSLNFPLYDGTDGFNGPLYDWENPDQLTVFGEFYRNYVWGLIYTPTPTVTPTATPTPRPIRLPLVAKGFNFADLWPAPTRPTVPAAPTATVTRTQVPTGHAPTVTPTTTVVTTLESIGRVPRPSRSSR